MVFKRRLIIQEKFDSESMVYQKINVLPQLGIEELHFPSVKQ